MPPRRRRISRFGLALIGVLLVIIAAVVVLVALSSGGGSPRNAASTRTGATNPAAPGNRGQASATAKVTPGSVTVAVLNGTSTFHLAADIMSRLTAAGYKAGSKTNASTQGVTSTIVGYTQPGFRADALAVAKSLDLGSASVQGVAPADRSRACGSASTCRDQVVVTAGSDLASSASSTSAATSG